MESYRKHFTLKPVKLHKKDLVELEQILSAEMHDPSDTLKFGLTTSDHREIEANSASELFLKTLPNYTDNLSVDLRTWKNGYIDRTIGLKLHFNNGSVNISGTDETWFLGKCVQLDGFFKRKRPWYGILNWILPGLLGAMMVISVLALAIGIEAKSGLGVVSSSILIVANPFLLWLGLKQKIFPFIRVILSDPHRQIGRASCRERVYVVV